MEINLCQVRSWSWTSDWTPHEVLKIETKTTFQIPVMIRQYVQICVVELKSPLNEYVAINQVY